MDLGTAEIIFLLKNLAYSKTRKGERTDGQRGKANLEVSLGDVVADVSYYSGNSCDNRCHYVDSTPSGSDLHALGRSLWMVAWVVTICHY
jgi:hypothetical protein